MSETLTFTPEQTEISIEAIEGLGQRALQGAISAAERGGFMLSNETGAELRTVFDIDPSQELPLSAHGLGCGFSSEAGITRHNYLLPGYKPAAE